MSDSVIDASALGAIAFGEPEADAVRRQLSESRVHAPGLLPFELANIAWKKTRAHPDRADEYAAALNDGLRLDIQWQSVDYQGVLRLAVAEGITAYDAAYLWLARHLDLPLVTLDRKLAARTRLKTRRAGDGSRGDEKT